MNHTFIFLNSCDWLFNIPSVNKVETGLGVARSLDNILGGVDSGL